MKKARRKTFLFKLICFFVPVVLLAVCLYFSSNRIMEELAKSAYHSLISSASYHAIDEIIDVGYDYNSLIDIKTDSNGQINMIVTDSYKVNVLASKAATKAYKFLKQKTEEGVDIPLGAFSGIRLISGFGQPIKMKLISVSSVKCEIISDFTEAGINQTRHSLYFNIFCEVSIITKTSTKKISDKISVLVYDNLIIGKVPSIFVNSQVIGEGNEKNMAEV